MSGKNSLQLSRIFLYCLLAAATVFAFGFTPKVISLEELAYFSGSSNFLVIFVEKLRLSFSGHGIESTVFWIILIYFYSKKLSGIKSGEAPILILSFSFALFMLVGKCFALNTSLNPLFGDAFGIIASLVSLYGYSILFYLLLSRLSGWVVQNSSKDKDDSIEYYQSNRFLVLFNKHPFKFSFVCIFLFGLPYILFFYPGSVQWDGLSQLNRFYAIWVWNNHYPAISTILMGVSMKIGRYLIDDNFGIFVYTFSQFIITSGVFAYAIKYLKELKSPVWLTIGSLLFFALFPIWPMNSCTFVKDTLYYAFFLLFFIKTARYVMRNENNRVIDHIMLLILSLLVWIFRNDGFYVILFSLFALLFVNLNIKRIVSLAIVIILFITVQITYHSLFLTSMGIHEGSVREMLSVPMQQTARYSKEHGNEITEEEREILEAIFIIEVEEIAQRYNPEVSDNVKAFFTYSPTKKQLNDYFSVWFNQFLKQPWTYIEATLNNTYGYLYPDRIESQDGFAWYSIQYSELVYTGDFNLYFGESTGSVRALIEQSAYALRQLPGMGLLFSTGFYAWILLFFITVLIQLRKFKALIALFPLIGTFLVCFLSPVNAYIRYMLPVMAGTPVLIGYVLNVKSIHRKS